MTLSLARANKLYQLKDTLRGDEPRKHKEPSLREKIHAIQGYPKFAESEAVLRGFQKLASTVGITGMAKSRKAGSAAVQISKVPGKSIEDQTIDPGKSIFKAVSSNAPKRP